MRLMILILIGLIGCHLHSQSIQLQDLGDFDKEEIYWELRAREKIIIKELSISKHPHINFPSGLEIPQKKFEEFSSHYLADYIQTTIWGEDERQDYYEFCQQQCSSDDCKDCNKKITRNMRAVFLVITKDQLTPIKKDFFHIEHEKFYLYDGAPICNNNFTGQPQSLGSTGVLVSSKLILIARHQLVEISRMRFVFGFYMLGKKTGIVEVHKKNVYKSSVPPIKGSPDWALITLDVELPQSRPPVVLNRANDLSKGTGLYYMGHPDGLPWKHGPNAEVRKKPDKKKFLASLDAFNQASGSPVFNSTTHQLEGILLGTRDCHFDCRSIRMKDDQGQVCRRVFRCLPGMKRCEGFVCAKVSNFASYIPK